MFDRVTSVVKLGRCSSYLLAVKGAFTLLPTTVFVVLCSIKRKRMQHIFVLCACDEAVAGVHLDLPSLLRLHARDEVPAAPYAGNTVCLCVPIAGVHASDDGADVACPVSLVEWFLNFYKETRRGPVQPLEGICRAGEVLFVPRGWWHMALNLEVNLQPFILVVVLLCNAWT